MPTYVYEYLDEHGDGTGETFELVQPITADALKKHDGRKVHRVPQAVNIAGDWSEMKSKSKLSNKNLERLGFTKYERKGEGYMERVAGKDGPKSISSD
ncbi:MAG: FmdB family transcriptional regulator [Planctomycetota bacterium]